VSVTVKDTIFLKTGQYLTKLWGKYDGVLF